jgi:hypothetical protein
VAAEPPVPRTVAPPPKVPRTVAPKAKVHRTVAPPPKVPRTVAPKVAPQPKLKAAPPPWWIGPRQPKLVPGPEVYAQAAYDAAYAAAQEAQAIASSSSREEAADAQEAPIQWSPAAQRVPWGGSMHQLGDCYAVQACSTIVA